MTKYTPENKPRFTNYSPNPAWQKCSWLLGTKETGYKACGKKTEYIMVEEADGISHREHYAFCPEHLPLALAQPDEEEFE